MNEQILNWGWKILVVLIGISIWRNYKKNKKTNEALTHQCD